MIAIKCPNNKITGTIKKERTCIGCIFCANAISKTYCYILYQLYSCAVNQKSWIIKDHHKLLKHCPLDVMDIKIVKEPKWRWRG